MCRWFTSARTHCMATVNYETCHGRCFIKPWQRPSESQGHLQGPTHLDSLSMKGFEVTAWEGRAKLALWGPAWVLLAAPASGSFCLLPQSFQSLPPHPRFPRWLSSKESPCQCRRHKRHGFDPWVGKIPWRRKWQTTPTFLPEKSHKAWQATVHGVTKSQTRLSDWAGVHTMLYSKKLKIKMLLVFPKITQLLSGWAKIGIKICLSDQWCALHE